MSDGLVVESVSKQFGARSVLNDVSFALGQHELLVLLGASGCGKSTLLRCVAGLEEIDRGKISINGKRIDQLEPKDRQIALVFQNYALYPHMTVAQNLAFPLVVAKLPKEERATRVAATAALLGLTDRLSDKPASLSGGQRQRVALGRAIIREPALYLLDEPLSNLDAELRLRMRTEIVALQRRVGRAMIHVTHDQSEALTMGDKVALMHDGRLIQFGTPEDLYRRPASLFVAKFLGHPSINLIDVEIESGRLMPLGLPIPETATIPTGVALTVGLRPESIHVVSMAELRATVQAYEYLGDRYTMMIAFRNLHLQVSTVFADPPPVGEPIHFSVKLTDLLFFDRTTGARIPVSGLSGETTVRSTRQ